MPRIRTHSQSQVDRLRGPGRHAVAPGLYLVIADSGLRQYWHRRADEHGRRRWIVIGDAGPMKLAEAQARAFTAPLAAPVAANKARPFREAGADYIATHRKGWRNDVHARQWVYTIEELCRPLHGLLADRIAAQDVAAVLRRLEDRPETLRRCRSRVAMVIDYELARLSKFDVVNPADLRLQGRLVAGLSKSATRRKRRTVRHHPAPSIEQLCALWGTLDWASASHLGLRWIMVTLARTTEVRKASRSEIKRASRLWVMPSERTKTEVRHDVPLTDQALVVLAAAQRQWPTAKAADLLFPGLDAEPLDINAMRQAMQRALDRNVTPHGIRATFRTWARDTGRDETLAELALAHAVDDETTAAYARTNALDRRTKLLEEWCAVICGDQPGNVVAMVPR